MKILKMLAGGCIVAAVVGFSLHTALTPLPLASSSPPLPAKTVAVADSTKTPDIRQQKQLDEPRTLETRSPTSGAMVQRTLLPDGSVVTKYAPSERDGTGPELVQAPHIGQDLLMAGTPNPDLLQDSPVGRLPVIGPDGLRPVEQYARPWSGAHGTRIAIVVGGLGLSQTGTQRAIQLLPPEVTLAFASTGNSLGRWMQDARRAGHEILLQVPFEPYGYPANDPGRGTLRVNATAPQNLEDLHRAMASLTNYTGIMNYMGARFLSDAAALDPVMRDISSRGLLFLDDGSAQQSLTSGFAKALNMPYAVADLQIDDQLQSNAILNRLDELERIARRNGSAIGVASAFDESVAGIAKWVHEAEGRGIEIVGVSALALDAQK
nr:divergent polysaccharide deacetylase family protein [Allorhizobium sonneratiae]